MSVVGSATARATPAFVSVKVVGPAASVDQLTPADLSVTVEYRRGAAGEIEVKPDVRLANDSGTIRIVSVSPDSIRLKGK